MDGVDRGSCSGAFKETSNTDWTLREVLEQTRAMLSLYADLLASACGVPDLSKAIPRPVEDR
jgi:hypothetical protein